MTTQRMRLSRKDTGFERATQRHFDLDGDGEAGIAVREGVGHGPGHLDGPSCRLEGGRAKDPENSNVFPKYCAT